MKGFWFLHNALLIALYQVSFPKNIFGDMLWTNNIAKNRKENKSMNTGERVMGLAFYTLPYTPLSAYLFVKFHLFIFNISRDVLWTSLLFEKLGSEATLSLLVKE